MMKSAPTSSLEMPQPQFLFQFFVVAFDDPTKLGQEDQVPELRFRRQGGQPILRGFSFSLRPLDEQPLFRTRFAALLDPDAPDEPGARRTANGADPSYRAAK